MERATCHAIGRCSGSVSGRTSACALTVMPSTSVLPGDAQNCPAHAAGRTEAILVSPAPHTSGADALRADAASAAPSGGDVAQVSRPAAHVVVTATWSGDPAAVRNALGVRSVGAAGRGYAQRPALSIRHLARLHAGGASSNATTATPTTTVAPSPATAGEIYNGLGFDACSAPSSTAMAQLGGVTVQGDRRLHRRPGDGMHPDQPDRHLGRRGGSGRLAPDPDLRRAAVADQWLRLRGDLHDRRRRTRCAGGRERRRGSAGARTGSRQPHL